MTPKKIGAELEITEYKENCYYLITNNIQNLFISIEGKPAPAARFAEQALLKPQSFHRVDPDHLDYI